VVNWYLEEISGDIESQEELLEKKLIVEKVTYSAVDPSVVDPEPDPQGSETFCYPDTDPDP
jgi:hypothetical protein